VQASMRIERLAATHEYPLTSGFADAGKGEIIEVHRPRQVGGLPGCTFSRVMNENGRCPGTQTGVSGLPEERADFVKIASSPLK